MAHAVAGSGLNIELTKLAEPRHNDEVKIQIKIGHEFQIMIKPWGDKRSGDQ